MNLVLNTTQKLLMSQKMLQSTTILQMSTTELMDYINTLTEENPVLEVKNKYDDEPPADILKRKIEYLDSSDEQNRMYYSEEKDDEDENDMWKFRQSTEESLTEFIISQINVLKIPKKEMAVCDFIAGCLDESGYLRQTNEQIAKSLNITESEAENAVKTLQSLEPDGVCARNLSQCLMLKSQRLNI